MTLERLVEAYEQTYARRSYFTRLLSWKRAGVKLAESESYYKEMIEGLEYLESNYLDRIEKEVNEA